MHHAPSIIGDDGISYPVLLEDVRFEKAALYHAAESAHELFHSRFASTVFLGNIPTLDLCQPVLLPLQRPWTEQAGLWKAEVGLGVNGWYLLCRNELEAHLVTGHGSILIILQPVCNTAKVQVARTTNCETQNNKLLLSSAVNVGADQSLNASLTIF